MTPSAPLYPTREEAYQAYRRAPDAFFAEYHRRHFDERELISPDWTWYETRYHYNLVENGIVDLLRESGRPVTGASVLDVGSGTGHWIEFYAGVLEAREVVGTDFSDVAVEALRRRFEGEPRISVELADVSLPRAAWDARFDVVNAVGILFHIVDDARWTAAVHNLARWLAPGGVALIGGDFGSETRELGVMRRVRSLELWEATLAAAGCRVCGLKRFDWFKGGVNDGLKNNLLAFERA